jgi:acyl dehydratase
MFDQLRVGMVLDLGSHTFETDEIITFAREFDPQPFHTDIEAAKASHFGGLCASGWHTCAVWMRLGVASFEALAAARGESVEQAFGPSPGFQALKWLKPVYAGDSVRFSNRISEKRVLASRPDWGIVSMQSEGVNQHGAPVISFLCHVFVKR